MLLRRAPAKLDGFGAMGICTSWGMYPQIECQRFKFDRLETLKRIIEQHNSLISYGNGRSYGDSALSEYIVDMRQKSYFIDFDEKKGLLHVQAGVLLSDILKYFVPRGWFLRVTPGTKFITVGGAIAADVHGKNHHVEGCFSESVKEFKIMLADGTVVTCTKESNPDLWRATCGGQGLTGVVLEAKLFLKRINSKYINQTTIKTKNLQETFEAFEEYKDRSYSVAWIDCLAKGEGIGRSLLMVGDFRDDGKLDYSLKPRMSIPFNFPSFVLNNWSVRAFNWLYYRKVKKEISQQVVDIDAFFYPLDFIRHWNRIYGKKGFIQYQFILPKEASYEGLREILTTISRSGKGSFLAVLKLCGNANDNWLSFPMEGYTLALDFKVEKGIFKLLNRLDEIVLKYKGRFYLAKDARVTKSIFEQGYPDVEKFRQFRKDNGMDLKFRSLQSRRLSI